MRVSRYMDTEKLRIIMKAFIVSQFKYCSLVLIFHSRHIIINKLHERALRVVYKDESCTFEDLLAKDNSFTVHERNFQKLALSMFKVKHKLCPVPVQDLFNQNEEGKWIIPKIRTENYGKETLRYRGPVTWNLLPMEIKSTKTLKSFEDQIVKLADSTKLI